MSSLTYRSNTGSPAGGCIEADRRASNGSRSAAAIEARGLTKRFGDVLAAENVTFTVQRGSVVAFLGPNGAGKTTTLRMLLGLITPSAGSATINGLPYQQLPSPQSAVGAVLDSAAAHPGRTARDHLRVHALAGGAPPPASRRCSTWSSSARRPAGGSVASHWGCASGWGSRPRCCATPRS